MHSKTELLYFNYDFTQSFEYVLDSQHCLFCCFQAQISVPPIFKYFQAFSLQHDIQ